MTRADKILLLVILLVILSIYCLFSITNLKALNSGQKSATIKARGEVIERVLLPVEKNRKVVVEGRIGSTIIELEKDRLRVLEAPCAEQICKGRGWISYPGESIICVPNEVVIIIEGKESGIDAILQ